MLINLIISLAVGALAGWLAGEFMKSNGGLLRNIILGICGSVVGRFIAGLLGISASTISVGGIIISVAGACLIIFLGRKLLK